MGFIKKQQWVVTNYAVVIYAAIVWVGKNVETISTDLRWFLSAAIVVTGIYAIGLLIKFHRDLIKERKSADKATAYCFTNEQRIKLDLPDYKHPFLRGCEVLFAVILVCGVGAAVAVCTMYGLKTVA